MITAVQSTCAGFAFTFCRKNYTHWQKLTVRNQASVAALSSKQIIITWSQVRTVLLGRFNCWNLSSRITAWATLDFYTELNILTLHFSSICRRQCHYEFNTVFWKLCIVFCAKPKEVDYNKLFSPRQIHVSVLVAFKYIIKNSMLK